MSQGEFNFNKTQTKEEAMALLERTRVEFLTKARAIAKRICRAKGWVTTDDIRNELPIPDGIDGRVMGAVFNTSEWEAMGYKKSTIKSSHRRPITIFKIK